MATERASDPTCTCPSGDGSLRWPCPKHPPAAAPAEMSPEFTDTARAAIAWVLWHHQGASSPVGQPLRFALGMGADEPLPDWRIAEAKRYAAWAGATTAKFHEARAITPAAPGIDPDAVERLRNLAAYAGAAGCPSMGGDIKALLDALDASPKGAAPAFHVPAGWSLVRTEPTAEMLDAGINEIDYDGNEVTDNVRNVWLAMIEAARKDSPKGGSEAWREGWALAYSGPSRLYGDDGELQDNSEYPYIDWRRDSAEVIRGKITERANRKLAQTQAGDAEVQP